MPQVKSATAPAFAGGEPEQLTLFEEGSIDVSVLRMERAALRGSSRSSATRRAYASDWRDFSWWCGAAGRASAPASADTVSLYAVFLARAGRAVATIRRRLASVASRHLEMGYASPVSADVREVLSGIGRKVGTAPHAKAAVSLEELRRMVAAIDGRAVRGVYSWPLPGGPLLVARDRAVLLLGFAGGFRRSELAGLDVNNLTFEGGGLVVRLQRSKTDQEGRGRELGIHRGRRPLTDPERALRAWLDVRGSWGGPLFVRVGAGGQASTSRLSGAAVAAIVKSAAARAGLDASRYGGHSLRAGLATVAAGNGASDRAIMARTGHTTSEMVGRYIRHGTLFACDPLAGLL